MSYHYVSARELKARYRAFWSGFAFGFMIACAIITVVVVF